MLSKLLHNEGALPARPRFVFVQFDQEHHMGGSDKKGKLLRKDERKPKKSPPKPAGDDDHEDGDHEDGDIATPKRDRYGEDDEPL
jgi:hypothetical protein